MNIAANREQLISSVAALIDQYKPLLDLFDCQEFDFAEGELHFWQRNLLRHLFSIKNVDDHSKEDLILHIRVLP